jgi:translocation and assembly module TamA
MRHKTQGLRKAEAIALPVMACLLASAAQAQEPLAQIVLAPEASPYPKSLRTRVEAVIISSRKPPQSPLEARRHARDAADLATAALRSEGRYAAMVTPSVTDGDPPAARLTLDPGPAFGFADPKVEWIGEPPALGARLAGEASLGLELGAPGRAAEVVAAEGRVLAAVEKRGYADVVAWPREVIVDHADHSLRPTFKIAAGARVRLDGALISTDGPTHLKWAGGLAPWAPGDVYAPSKLADFEQRLLDTGVYDAVNVSLSPTASADGLRPVLVTLLDRPKRSLEASASYSTSEGVGAEGRVVWYNRGGRGDSRTLKVQAAVIKSGLDYEVSQPHWRRPRQTLKFGGGLTQQFTDAYDETGAGLRADLTRARGRASYTTWGVAVDATRTRAKTFIALNARSDTTTATTVSLLGAIYLDQSDDVLNPRRGWRLDLRSEPIISVGSGTQAFVKSQAQASAYVPLTAQAATVLAARLHVGSVVGAAVDTIPAARRFYAGGGGSVRGYAYQGVGPRFADNTPKGGTALWDSSLELRQRVTGPWGVVAFVDAGSTGDGAVPDFGSVSAGAGLGLRFDPGFGPVRFDLAVPLSKRSGDPSFQIYLSIGQSF